MLFSVYLFTVPVNVVCVKFWCLATKVRFWSKTCVIPMQVYFLHPHTNSEVLTPYRSEDMAHFVCLH